MEMLIGLTGYKRCGKDTVANILAQEHGFQKVSFADPLRDLCASMFELPMQMFVEDELKDTPLPGFGKSPREILIHIGQSMRQIDPDVWARQGIKKACSIRNHVVIPDVRFPNEANYIIERGGVLLRIERSGCELGNDIPTTGLYEEFPQLPTIQNDGSIDDLRTTVAHFIERLRSSMTPREFEYSDF